MREPLIYLRNGVLYWGYIHLPVDIPRTFGAPAEAGPQRDTGQSGETT